MQGKQRAQNRTPTAKQVNPITEENARNSDENNNNLILCEEAAASTPDLETAHSTETAGKGSIPAPDCTPGGSDCQTNTRAAFRTSDPLNAASIQPRDPNRQPSPSRSN